MNKRQNAILIEIAYKNLAVCPTIQHFAASLDVSEQTIRNDIKEINCMLLDNNQPQIDIDDYGRFHSSSPLDLSFFDGVDFYKYKLSPDERHTVLAMILLTMDGYTTIAELSERVMVSRNTLINDLDDLKAWFQENGLSFVSQPRKGLLVMGSELSIRDGLLKLLLLNDSVYGYEKNAGNDMFHILLLQQLDAGRRKANIQKILKDAEDAQDISLTDFSFKEMCYCLMILVSRVEKGNYIGALTQEQWDKVKHSSKFEMAEILITELAGSYNFSPRYEEIAFIIERLRMESYIKNNKISQDTDMIDIQILINEFIYKLSKAYDINYYLNFYLYDLLLTHMKAAAYRVKQKHLLSTPMTAQLETEHKDMFMEIAKHLRPLEEYLRAEISKDEISFIVMYLLAILEKNKVNNTQINALLVCNSGQGTAQLMLAKISSAFNQIIVKDIVSSHRIADMPMQGIDLILSTVSFGELGVPAITITPLIDNNDVSKIQHMIMRIQKGKQQLPGSADVQLDRLEQIAGLAALEEGKSLFDLLSAERVLLDADAKDWRQAVRFAGNMLSDNGLTEERYTENMIKNIEENGPYVVIYPGIAIPHARRSDGSLTAGASFVRLSEPVQFNHKENDPVSFIIAFSLIDSGSIGRALYNLTKMLSAEGFIEQLVMALDAEALMGCIKRYESFIDTNGRQ